MLFVTGGAYQGKLDYVMNRYHLRESDICFCSENEAPDFSVKCICHYEKYVMYAVRNGIEPVTCFDGDMIVIMDDICCGVVPADPETRAFREAAGRTGCALTRSADEVVRIFCGLPATLK